MSDIGVAVEKKRRRVAFGVVGDSEWSRYGEDFDVGIFRRQMRQELCSR
jgi:hypothetical protein